MWTALYRAGRLRVACGCCALSCTAAALLLLLWWSSSSSSAHLVPPADRLLPAFLTPHASHRISSPKHTRLQPRFSTHASENVMGGMPLPLPLPLPKSQPAHADGEAEEGSDVDDVDGGANAAARTAENARLIAMYKAEFALSWAEESKWHRREGGGGDRTAASAPPSPTRAGTSLSRSAPQHPALLLPAASHAAARGRNPSGSSTRPSSSPSTSTLLLPALPPFACAVVMSLNADMCRTVWLQYRTLHRVHPSEVDYVVVFDSHDAVREWRLLTSDPYCRLLYSQSRDFLDADAAATSDAGGSGAAAVVGRVRFLPVVPMELPAWNAPRFSRWSYSYNKLSLLDLTDYQRILYLDADVIVAAPLTAFFALPFPLAAALDTAQSCRKAQTKLNAGVLAFAPSPHLYSVFHSALYTRSASCISGALEEVEQELLNCICGLGQEGAAALPLRPDVQCGVLPYYANVVPSYAHCEDYDDDEVLLVHFADVPKPQQWEQTDCRRLAVNATWERGEEWFADAGRAHCFLGESAFHTFYHCMEGGDDDSHRLRIGRDCRLISLDKARWASNAREARSKSRTSVLERLRGARERV